MAPEIPRLTRMAGHLARSGDRDDLLQETLLRAYRAIDRFDGRYPRAWTATIMRNAWRNMLRGGDRVTSLRAEQLIVDATDGLELPAAEAVLEPGLSDALAALPPAQWAAVSLVDLEGFSYAETAQMLAVPVGTVMSRLHRGRSKLRDELIAILMSEGHSLEEPAGGSDESGGCSALCRTLIKHEPVILFSFDAAGTIMNRDGKGLHLLGQTNGAGVGKRIVDFPCREPAVVRHVEQALAGHPTVTRLDVHGTRVQVYQSVLRDAQERLTGVVGVAVFGHLGSQFANPRRRVPRRAFTSNVADAAGANSSSPAITVHGW